MKTTISQLTTTDVRAVDKLMKRNSQTLGFLTRETLLEGFLNKKGALGAKTDDGQLVGYLLYANYPKYFRIAQLCVSEDFRGQGIAKRLFESLKNSVTTQQVIKLRCRRDFPAHQMWPELGFVPLDERPGRSSAGHLLTLWYFPLAPDDQLSLFQAETSDESLDVVIDAQVFFDFYESDSDKTRPSKALFSDFLIDSLNLWITDELFVEIVRKNDPIQREKSRQKAYEFQKVSPNPQSFEHFEGILTKLLPRNSQTQQSDIRQLAKAAASEVKTFVTRDQALLNKAGEIANLTKLRVVSPTALIIQVHESSQRQSYAPDRIAGLKLRWKRLTADDLVDFPFESFLILKQGEKKGKFRERVGFFLADPNRYECGLLWSENEIVAIRVLSKNSDVLITHLARVARSADQSLFGRFLIADTISQAVERNLSIVKFEEISLSLSPNLIPDLIETGFTKSNDSFVRFCFSLCLDRQEVLSRIAELSSESTSRYEEMTDLELERCCSPLSLESTDQNHFLIPIKPGYAMSLVDRDQSGSDLFGGKTNVLLRWGHVYYRGRTYHKILNPPARILWYVSGKQKQLVALSHLDEVEIDSPKILFRKFKRFGILEWKELYEMCGGDPSKEIMALKFSHTFPLQEPVSLSAMKTVFKKDGIGLWLQSPLKIPPATFRKLFQRGYPCQP